MSTSTNPDPPTAAQRSLETVLKEEGRELLLLRMRVGILLGIPLYLGFSFLDHIVAKDLWSTFLLIRISVVAVAIICLAIPALGYLRKQARALSFIITYTGSAGISVMTMMLDGNGVEYYAGIMMILFLVGLFCPWGFRLTFIYSASVLATYLGLNLITSPIDEVIVPTFFLVGSAMLTCWASEAIEKSRRKEITLRAQLEEANDELKELDEAKTKFFANVSHELRTPLMLILGPLESLLEGDVDESDALLRAMDANAHRLMRQVNMILNFSKLEAGQQTVDRELGNVGKLLESLVQGAAPFAQGRDIRLTGESLEGLPDIPFDHEKIETTAANLISNAMKFTPNGGAVTVRGGVAEGGIWFEVEDTGCGIPEAHQAKVFERFHQVDGGKNGKVQGTGLGLALSKELVEMHGGKLTLTSTPGEGTTFRVELPDADAIGWSREASAEAESATTSPARNVSTSTQFADLAQPGLEAAATESAAVTAPENAPTLLLVEDNHDMRAFVAGALRRHYKVHTAVDGQDGVETARRVQPDLIVSDVMMPRMDGFEMVEKLRTDRRFDRTPIVMLTARTGAEAVVRGLKLGAVDYVAKPFKMPELLARISAQLKMRAVEAELAERDSRLVAVGQMTGSIAHDMRGPLNGIYNRIEIVRMVSEKNG
jgi:signal transduction histidine kinase